MEQTENVGMGGWHVPQVLPGSHASSSQRAMYAESVAQCMRGCVHHSQATPISYTFLVDPAQLH